MSKYNIGDKVRTIDNWNNGMGKIIPKGSIVTIEFNLGRFYRCNYKGFSAIYEPQWLGEIIKNKTNADRIRQMTDEELAELFVHWSCDDADYATLLPIKGVIWGTREEMIKCNLEYLKQEVEEKDE